jgi:hypothetical protein
VRRLVPHGGLTLKVNSVDTLLPVATCSIHSLLVQCGQLREPPGHAPSSLVCGS